MDSTALSASMTQSLVAQVYERLFGESGQHFDLYEGTISSAANVRVIYLSADIVRGVYDALSYEAGEAWTVILHNCGVRWGKRVSASVERELRAVAGRRLDGLMVKEYCDLLSSYFSLHGWGKLHINLDYAQQYGVLCFNLDNSLFSGILTKVEGPVDHMVEGMLQGMFEVISGGQALRCVQIIPEGEKPYARIQLLLSGAKRIASIEDEVKPGMSLNDVLVLLKVPPLSAFGGTPLPAARSA
jgi:uncharacterized protein